VGGAHAVAERRGGLDAEEEGVGRVLVVDGDGGGEAGCSWLGLLLIYIFVVLWSLVITNTGKEELLVCWLNYGQCFWRHSLIHDF
jgi:hypothetical protein